MSALPETILQFGAGNFLRAFADLFIHQANEAGQAVGRVVVVQSTGDGAGQPAQPVRRPLSRRRPRPGGRPAVDRVEESRSISRALFAATQWDDVLAVGRVAGSQFVLSNTTEAGYELDESDLILCQHSPGPSRRRSPAS